VRRVTTALALGCLFAIPAAAQPGSTLEYDGKWSAVIQRDDGSRQTARVVIEQFAGTWQDQTRPNKANKTCAGKAFPITIQESTASELALMVWGSSISTACPDLKVDLKPAGDTVLEGSIATLGQVRLTKSPAPKR